MTSFDGKPIAQVARWEVACLQTILVQLGLSAVTLRQISEGLQKICQTDCQLAGFSSCEFLFNANFCVCKQQQICNRWEQMSDL